MLNKNMNCTNIHWLQWPSGQSACLSLTIDTKLLVATS